MNISSALKKAKLLRNELKRKIKIRKENFYAIIPKDITLQKAKEEPEKFDLIDFDIVTKEINEITSALSDLREQILRTNINTKVEVEKEQLTLARLKLKIDDTRSELAQLETISERGLYRYDRRRKIITSEEEEKEVAQFSDVELEKKIKELEEKKIALENLLEFKNANTELIE